MGELNFVPVSLKRSRKGKLKYNQCHHHLDAPKFKLKSLKRNHSSETGKGNETSAAKAILAKVRKGDLTDGFTAREIQRRGWSNLSATGGR
jgi:hypothetical protein